MSPSVRSRKVKSRIPKPTSGHLKVEILIRPLDTKKKYERSRCPEVGLGILGFIIRTLRRAQEKHAKYIGFPYVFSTSRKLRRFLNIDR